MRLPTLVLLLATSCAVDPDEVDLESEEQEVFTSISNPLGTLKALGGRCLDVKGAIHANRTPIMIHSCNGGSNQKWYVPSSSIDGPVISKMTPLEMVLDAPYTYDYSTTWLFEYWGGDNQLWRFQDFAIQYKNICVAPLNTSTTAIAMAGPCIATALNQRWNWDTQTKQIRLADGRCLGADAFTSGSTARAVTCANATVYPFYVPGTQQWTAIGNGGLRLGTSNSCLDFPGGTITATWSSLQVHTCNGTSAQKFRIRGSLRGKQSGKCLSLFVDASGIPDTSDGEEPLLLPCTNAEHQKWELEWSM
ncbi:MAG: ricin-type beta-trefoil lectin domain protein [Kofleriaceae bacterium]